MISRGSLEQRIAALEQAERQRQDSIAATNSAAITEAIAPCYLPLHEDIQAGQHRFYNLPGGRGSCKSSFVSLEIVDGIQSDPTGQSNAIVFRRVAGTMRDSVFSQISWAIDLLGVSHLWKPTVSPMAYEYLPTGAQILFRGLDDASKLKSIKPRHGFFRFVWFEEFAELPGPQFARNVLQSVIRGHNAKPMVFRSFNPPMSMSNWANQFITEPDTQALTFHTDYTMIPPDWLGDAFILEAERLKATNPKAFEHEYLGIATGTGAEVFPALEVREITPEEIQNMEYFFYGVDFGFAADPACFLRCSYDRKHETIYLLNEIYKRGLLNRQLAAEIKPLIDGDSPGSVYNEFYHEFLQGSPPPVYCDAAEPKSIADLRDSGIKKALACHKEPGCVEYRVKWLQHRRIVVDPARTPNAARELANYEYEKDKDGNILSRLPDKDNHSIDSLAYALDREIYHRKGQSA